jgi:murein DD-endopeptidase MepM/ murein hydrolase activator NlpD
VRNSTTPEGQTDRPVIENRTTRIRTTAQARLSQLRDRFTALDRRQRLTTGTIAVAALAAIIATAVGTGAGAGAAPKPTAATAAGARSADRAAAADRADRSTREAVDAKDSAAQAADAKKKAATAKKKAAAHRAATMWTYPMTKSDVTSCYEYRTDPYPQYHKGIDFANVAGTPLRAAHAGKVIAAGDAGDGYGNKVVINHGNKTWTLYGHASRVAVHAGQHVAAGQIVSYEGSTGDSTGPHLHFEVWKGSQWNQVDPTPFLEKHGLKVKGC